jgi:uncharacterized glyoxalase superfamily protein PhnB
MSMRRLRAIAAGGESLGVPEDRHYGERAGFVRDAYGNHWYIATALGPQSLGHALRTVTPYLHSRDVDGYMAFLARAFGAVEETRAEQPGGVIPYARMRFGDAAVEFGTSDPMPGAYFLYVADPMCIRAGAAAADGASPPRTRRQRPNRPSIQGNHWAPGAGPDVMSAFGRTLT